MYIIEENNSIKLFTKLHCFASSSSFCTTSQLDISLKLHTKSLISLSSLLDYLSRLPQLNPGRPDEVDRITISCCWLWLHSTDSEHAKRANDDSRHGYTIDRVICTQIPVNFRFPTNSPASPFVSPVWVKDHGEWRRNPNPITFSNWTYSRTASPNE